MYSSQLDSFREAISNAFVKAFFLLITKLIAVWHEVYLCIILYRKCFYSVVLNVVCKNYVRFPLDLQRLGQIDYYPILFLSSLPSLLHYISPFNRPIGKSF
jgi:hypothetical protein